MVHSSPSFISTTSPSLSTDKMERKSAEAGPSSNKDRRRPGPWPPGIEPFVSKTDHDPRELKSWANRTGFNHNFSGESTLSSIIDEGGEDAPPPPPPPPPPTPPPPHGRGGRRLGNGAASKVELEPILGQRRACADINPVTDLDSKLVGLKDVRRRFEKEKKRIGVEPEFGLMDEGRGLGNDLPVRGKGEGINGIERGNGEHGMTMGSGDREAKKDEVEIDLLVDPPEPQITPPFKSGLMCDLMENPGFGRLFLYGIQHYLSLTGSLIFIPLIMVPSMGGTDGETANVISTVLLVSGITTIMHSFFGTRLPLVQGSSFVYLAPALVIINSEEYRNLSDNDYNSANTKSTTKAYCSQSRPAYLQQFQGSPSIQNINSRSQEFTSTINNTYCSNSGKRNETSIHTLISFS